MDDHLVPEWEYLAAYIARMRTGRHDDRGRRRGRRIIRYAQIGAHNAAGVVRIVGQGFARLHHHARTVVQDGYGRRMLLVLVAAVRRHVRSVGRLQFAEYFVIGEQLIQVFDVHLVHGRHTRHYFDAERFVGRFVAGVRAHFEYLAVYGAYVH